MNAIILPNTKKQSCLNRARLKMGADNEKQSEKNGIGKEGCYAVPFHSRSLDTKKRGAPSCEAYCSIFFKACIQGWNAKVW
jgi:hypothetical protein